MASGPITSWEIDGETVETVSDFILGVFLNLGYADKFCKSIKDYICTPIQSVTVLLEEMIDETEK